MKRECGTLRQLIAPEINERPRRVSYTTKRDAARTFYVSDTKLITAVKKSADDLQLKRFTKEASE